jgi:hypothetical protein
MTILENTTSQCVAAWWLLQAH